MRATSLLRTLLLLTCMQGANASLITIDSPSIILAYHGGAGITDSASFTAPPVGVGNITGDQYSNARIDQFAFQSALTSLELLTTTFRQQRNDNPFSSGFTSIGGFGQTRFTVTDSAADISFRIYGSFLIGNIDGYNVSPNTPRSISFSSSLYDITDSTEILIASASNSVQDAENALDESGQLTAGHMYRWEFYATTVGKTSSFDFGTLSLQLSAITPGGENEIPEPSSLSLLALGGALLAAVRNRRHEARSRP